MNKQQLLDDIKADIVKNSVCPELAAGATNLVFGEGNPDAEIVFIGEAPGKKEDEQGLPFVGAAGQFLNDMLQSIQLNRNQIYITNIVKYRPPNNSDPLPEEKQEFLPYLERQLDVIKPLLVVTLGRHSMNVFLPNMRISQVHGQPKKIAWKSSGESSAKKFVVLPLFHPAAALYNGGLRQTLKDDFMNIKQTLNIIRKGSNN